MNVETQQGIALRDKTKRSPPDNSQWNDKVNRNFRRFRLGLALFFVGFVSLYAVDQLWQPSLVQEILAAVSVFIIISGVGMALLSELLFIAYRVREFFSSK